MHLLQLFAIFQEMEDKVFSLGLITYPASLAGYSCSKCPEGDNRPNAASMKEILDHIKVIDNSISTYRKCTSVNCRTGTGTTVPVKNKFRNYDVQYLCCRSLPLFEL